MAIEINGRTPSQANGSGESSHLRAVRNDEGNGARQAGAAGNTQDTVTLTGTAALMNRLHSDIAAAPVVDQQRVDAIRQQIAEGSYAIDPMRVAEKLLNMESTLFAASA
ncbi:MAG: flagellar biosynthesis anti-sigma factor FlgM [Gammaproteobacteria bacterium]|jgi:negative regulator of flagellin synthesis FlgM|nr:flagellar biosynthesis anti-sigma factor FlgM [Gammaproteobacteria bacterium]